MSKKLFPFLAVALAVVFAALASAAPDTLQAFGHVTGWTPAVSDLMLLPLGMAMNPGQARVVDPILTSVAQGYQQDEFVGGALFPTVPVNQRAGRIITFGKESFQLVNTARAPGENTKRVQFGYAGAPYALIDFSLEGQVAVEMMEESLAVPGIDQEELAINGVQAIMALGLEYAQAQIARNAASYAASNKVTPAAGDKWSASTSDPIEQVEAAKEAIRASTGKLPTTMVLGASVFSKLKNHPKVIERIKYTGRDVPTVALLSSLFDIPDVRVGRAVSANDAGQFADVWGKDVVLAYTPTAGLAQQGLPSYGYTYNLSGYPVVEPAYPERNPKSWFYPVTRVEAPVLAAPLAGYLITGAVA